MKADKYWMVHCPDKGNPYYRHYTAEDARNEAKRLARENPGFSFFVLKSVTCFQSELQEPTVVKLEKFDGPPF